jgi:hypothetical protein
MSSEGLTVVLIIDYDKTRQLYCIAAITAPTSRNDSIDHTKHYTSSFSVPLSP